MKKQFITPLYLWVALLLIGCNRYHIPTRYETETTKITQAYEADAEVEEVIAPYKKELHERMNRVIGFFAHDLYKNLPESELGNFLSDAPQEYYNHLPNSKPVDFTLMNYGGIRIEQLTAGEVTVKDMFELMPFENKLVVLELPGKIVKEVMSRVARKGGWPISNTVNVVIKDKKIEEFYIHGDAFDEQKTYRVLFNDYIANGGDGMDMLEGIEQEETGLKVRDVLIQYLEQKMAQNESVTARITGRIIVID